MVLELILLVAGFVVLIKGADFLVSGSSSIAKKYNVSNLAIGLTVVAFGTSMPELLVNIMSSISGYNDAAFGNVIGSNNFNLLFILGIAGLIYPLAVQRSTIAFEIPISIVAVGLLFFLVNDKMISGDDENILSRLDSFALLIFFVLFLLYVWRSMKTASDIDQESVKIYSMPKSLLFVGAGLGMLIGGGNLVVENAVSIAHRYGLSERLIGLTILAAGTSLPELATSAVAAFKKQTDIAIGNVIGSNIFNIFFILGTTGLIRPLPYNNAMNFDIAVLLGSSVLLMIFMFTINRRKLDRWEALILLLIYIVYTVVLIREG